MPKSLYLTCPTDCLESVINNTFSNENYFYTSLGNSVCLNTTTIQYITKLINKHQITEISFVITTTNAIVLDAIGTQKFSDIRGLDSFYAEIEKQKKHSEKIYQSNQHFYLLSYFLRRKINQLQLQLQNRINHSLTISGKIYNTFENRFENIFSELFYIEEYYLN